MGQTGHHERRDAMNMDMGMHGNMSHGRHGYRCRQEECTRRSRSFAFCPSGLRAQREKAACVGIALPWANVQEGAFHTLPSRAARHVLIQVNADSAGSAMVGARVSLPSENCYEFPLDSAWLIPYQK